MLFSTVVKLPLAVVFFSEQIINRIIELTKEQGDAIEDKVCIHRCCGKKNVC